MKKQRGNYSYTKRSLSINLRGRIEIKFLLRLRGNGKKEYKSGRLKGILGEKN